MRYKSLNLVRVVLLLGLPLVTILFCLGFGRYELSAGDTLRVLLSPIFGTEAAPIEISVIFGVRLPRVLAAACCGSALALSGAAFQSLFNNPLATPDTLGVSSGASCGAVIGLMFRLNIISVQICALCFGLGAVALTWNISKVRGKNSIIMIVLSGMVIGALFEAAISLLKYVADPEETLPTITYWLMGSLSGANYSTLLLGLPLIAAGAITVYLLRWRLNILALSEDEARSMGINLRAMRLAVILAATAMTASCVSMCGKIGWIGLLIPHISRMICGGNNQKIIPMCFSLGAIFALVIDTCSRCLTAAEIPMSILTALVGAPVFISLLRKTKGEAQ